MENTIEPGVIEQNVNKSGINVKGIIKKVLIALGIIVLVCIAAVWGVWHNEISTAMSIKKLSDSNEEHRDGNIYQMKVSGDFYFDKFLAQGGAKTDAELIAFITQNITKGLLKMGISESDIACSSFTATTENGDRIFARNYDFARTNTAIVYTNPGGGRHASYSTIDLQFIGIPSDGEISSLMDKISALAAPFVPLDGINDAGLSCGIYMTEQGVHTNDEGKERATPTNQNTDRPDLTSTTMLRMVLDYCETVDEAVEMIKQYDLHDSANTSFHYMVADAMGNSAILEWRGKDAGNDTDGEARGLVVTYVDADDALGEAEAGAKDYQWVTNFIVDPGYYSSDEQKGGYDRYCVLSDYLTKKGGVIADDEEAMSLLSSVGRRYMHPNINGVTVHSVVYNLTQKTVYWIGNEHFGEEDRIHRFSL